MVDQIMTATLKDIVYMLRTEKQKAKNKHAFSTPSKGFYDEAENSRAKRVAKKNTALSIRYLSRYRQPD